MTRRQFWPFLFKTWLGMVAAVVLLALFDWYAVSTTASGAPNVVSSALFLAILLCGDALLLAAVARRLQDTSRHGGWAFVALIPFGVLVVLYWVLKPGTAGPNRFGPEPGLSAQ